MREKRGKRKKGKKKEKREDKKREKRRRKGNRSKKEGNSPNYFPCLLFMTAQKCPQKTGKNFNKISREKDFLRWP